MTEAIYLEVTEKAEAAHKAKRRVSVSGMLKILGVSRSGYRAGLKHVPLVFEYLEAFYNTKRIHSHCDYMSPNDYEELYRRLQQNEESMAS